MIDFTSVILFEIDPTSIAFFEFKRDAPWSIHMDRVARRFKAAQGMKIKAGDIHLFRPHDDVQAVQSTQDARLHLGINRPRASFLPKFGKALAFKAPDHKRQCKLIAVECQLLAYSTPYTYRNQLGECAPNTISRVDCEPVLSAMLPAEADDALIVGDQRTSKLDRRRNQKSVRRIAVFAMMQLIAAGGSLLTQRHCFDAGTIEETLDPCRNGNVEVDPSGVKEKRDLPNRDVQLRLSSGRRAPRQTCLDCGSSRRKGAFRMPVLGLMRATVITGL